MPNLYICEQGVKVNLEGEMLVCSAGGEVIKKIRIETVDRVLAFGNIQFTSQCLASLAERDIPVSFHSTHGRYRFSLHQPMGKNGQRRLSQYMLTSDLPYRLSFAKSITAAKISNSSEFIKRYGRRHEIPNLKEFIFTMESLMEKLASAPDRDAIMGLEGFAARVYFHMYGFIINTSLFFNGRSKRPPLDPVNALLSLGYTVFAGESASLIEGCGCDPSIGFLHEIQYGRSSLALDLCEEFRSVCIDRFVLYAAREGIFKARDFEVRDGGCYLVKDSMRRFYEEYEKWMQRDLGFSAPATWRGLLRRQAERLASAIDGKAEYIPLVYGDGDVCCSEL